MKSVNITKTTSQKQHISEVSTFSPGKEFQNLAVQWKKLLTQALL